MAESASKQTTKQLRVTQIRSGIGGTRRQRETLRTLGRARSASPSCARTPPPCAA